MPDETYDVALANPGEPGNNTLVLSGIDVLVPLEADLDGDPEQDDEVKLASLDGRIERVLLASDEDASEDADASRFVYRFRDVPPGVYALSVRVSDHRFAPLMSGIVITTLDARWNGKPLEAGLDAFRPAARAAEPDDDAPAPPPDEQEGCDV